MLIETYRLELESPRCHPGSEHWFAYADFAEDLSPALPYLNATIAGARYQPSVPALAFQFGDHTVSMLPHRIAVSHLEDRSEAVRVMERIVALVNDTWHGRNAIQPSEAAAIHLQPLQVYRLLPRTNCNLCSAPTCYAFALRLAVGQAQWSECPPLTTDAWSAQRDQLLTMLNAH